MSLLNQEGLWRQQVYFWTEACEGAEGCGAVNLECGWSLTCLGVFVDFWFAFLHVHVVNFAVTSTINTQLTNHHFFNVSFAEIINRKSEVEKSVPKSINLQIYTRKFPSPPLWTPSKKSQNQASEINLCKVLYGIGLELGKDGHMIFDIWLVRLKEK